MWGRGGGACIFGGNGVGEPLNSRLPDARPVGDMVLLAGANSCCMPLFFRGGGGALHMIA